MLYHMQKKFGYIYPSGELQKFLVDLKKRPTIYGFTVLKDTVFGCLSL